MRINSWYGVHMRHAMSSFHISAFQPAMHQCHQRLGWQSRSTTLLACQHTTATDSNMIRNWEIKQQKNVASFGEHTRPVKSLAFSENGYHLASAAEDCVKLWDLRKLKVLR